MGIIYLGRRRVGNEALADSNKQGVAGWRYFATKVMDYWEIVRAQRKGIREAPLKFDPRAARKTQRGDKGE